MTRQDRFEAYFTDSRGLEPGTMTQYRFNTQDGYRLPKLAMAYRDFCAGLTCEPDYLAARAEARKILPMVPVDVLDDVARAVLGVAR